MTSNRWRHRLRWSGLAVLAALMLSGASLWTLKSSYFKTQVERTMSDRLGLQVTIANLSLSLFPHPHLVGSQLIAKLEAGSDAPPFVTIERFSANVGPLSAWRRHVDALQVEGLRISVPPRPDTGSAAVVASDPGLRRGGGIVVDRLDTRDAVVTIVRREADKEPLVFRIHQLQVTDLGFDRVMAFSADLTNPVPEGRVESKGVLGPWNREAPADLPISGEYSFQLANLGTIRGIGGMLTSTGRYEGRLTRIVVTGETSTPDFSLDMRGRPVPLTTKFRATVNGTDGSTVLDRVEARLFETPIIAEGRIENLPGPGRRNIELVATVPNGRIEDLLALGMATARPVLVGDVSLKSRISLPPGRTPVRDRLRLDGFFGLGQAKFRDREVRARLLELSRRSQGRSKDQPIAEALTRLAGGFTLARGTLALRDLSFEVPGARVQLDGNYAVATSELSLAGTLRMQASVSQAVGGFKSIFVKPFDWIFRKDGAGAVLPIEIRGTPQSPHFGISLRRALTGAKSVNGSHGIAMKGSPLSK